MEITVSIQQGNDAVAVMHIKGNIDASSFLEVFDKAQELYKKPARNLIMDLSEVPHISDTGLVGIHKISLLYSGIPQNVESDDARPDFTHSQDARKRVKLLNPQPQVEKILEKAGFKLFFKVFSDLESAVKSF